HDPVGGWRTVLRVAAVDRQATLEQSVGELAPMAYSDRVYNDGTWADGSRLYSRIHVGKRRRLHRFGESHATLVGGPDCRGRHDGFGSRPHGVQFLQDRA